MSTGRLNPRNGAASIAIHVLLLTLAAVAVIPFIWLICATFKRDAEFFRHTFLSWRDWNRLTLDNYVQLFIKWKFGQWLVNSLFLASVQTILVVTFSSLGGFALSKYRFRGRRSVMLLMLVTMLLPSQVLLPSSYELMYRIGWIDSYAAILMPGAVSAFGVFLFRQAMASVPDELLQAGRVDGCSELRLWWEIALPIVRPVVGAYTLLSFLAAWNSFLWPQIVLQSEAKYTLPIGLANMSGLPSYEVGHGVVMAGTLLSILPAIVLFFVLQKDFVAGLSRGAVKG